VRLAKVKRSKNQLYMLDLKIVQPVCLTVRHKEEPWLACLFEHPSFDTLGKMARAPAHQARWWCEEHEIIHERIPPYSPQSNVIAERKNHTLTNLVNAMFDTAGLSKECWGEALLLGRV
jgi:hypothetical protein